MKRCEGECNQGRLCPERLARIREAKETLDAGGRERWTLWAQFVVLVLATGLACWVAGLALEALA